MRDESYDEALERTRSELMASNHILNLMLDVISPPLTLTDAQVSEIRALNEAAHLLAMQDDEGYARWWNEWYGTQ
jgi:hypothetical protein